MWAECGVVEIHDRPFIGSDALEAGLVRKYQLRSNFRYVFPDVYLNPDLELTLQRRAVAAWLWSHREGVLAGLTASALHGAKWIDEHLPIELVWSNGRRPPGIRTFDYRVAADELVDVGQMRVTTPARTAFDLGRRGRLDDAVARLDALGNATGFSVADVLDVAARHRGARGVRKLATALDLYDPGAESPKESWLRMVVIRAGFPRPRTQIPVVSASGRRYRLDMGWEDVKIAAEYDGEQHRVDRPQYASDIIRSEEVLERGWLVVRVVAENTEADIVARVHRAWNSRLRTDRQIEPDGDL